MEIVCAWDTPNFLRRGLPPADHVEEDDDDDSQPT